MTLALFATGATGVFSLSMAACSADGEGSAGYRPAAPLDVPCVGDDCGLQGIFVAPGGADDAPGTAAAPLRTIAAAMGRTRTEKLPIILCAATFRENLIVREGLILRGGFDCEKQWAPSSVPSIIAPLRGVPLEVLGAPLQVGVERVEFRAPDAKEGGESSIAVFLSRASHVVFRDVTFRAGHGGPGVAGASPPQGGTASNGAAGESLCYAGRPAAGPQGLDSPIGCAPGGAGGPGGLPPRFTSSVPPVRIPDVVSGSQGSPETLGGGGASGPGGHGLPGAQGTAGSSGAASTLGFGSLTETGYQASNSGTPGAPGTPGGGGGGGAGHFSTDTNPVCGDALGTTAAGGQGGYGGCGGAGAEGGGGGGASIALASYRSNVRLERGTFQTGQGGSGGLGGLGSPGQLGGGGGRGGAIAVLRKGSGPLGIPGGFSPLGGNGGKGGDGGHGGHGGPGGGGPSVGIFAVGSTTQTIDCRFVVGSGGFGGQGYGGRVGARGVATQVVDEDSSRRNPTNATDATEAAPKPSGSMPAP